MKKLCLLILLCLVAITAHATSYYEYTYKTSCLPNVKEFRTDMKDFFAEPEDKDWAQRAQKHGLYEYNVTTTQTKPIPREESCVIDGVEYKMKFTPVFMQSYPYSYKLAVQLYAGKKYLGNLFPFGREADGIYDSVGIKDGKIFVRGCAYEGADRSYCRYDYKMPDIPEETSYELILADEDKVVFPEFNVVELNCYEDLGKGFIELHSYEEGSTLPENYYRLKDNPKLTCGRASFEFKADGSVIIGKDGKPYTEFNLDRRNKLIHQITFNPNDFYALYIDYFNKKDLYLVHKDCFEKQNRLKCDLNEE